LEGAVVHPGRRPLMILLPSITESDAVVRARVGLRQRLRMISRIELTLCSFRISGI
jgi:hypothetical protein